MSGLGNVLTGFIGGAAGGMVAIGGVQRLREKREAVRRRKENSETPSEEPAHTGSGASGGPGSSGGPVVPRPREAADASPALDALTARVTGAETALSAQQERLDQFAVRFDRVLGKAAKNPSAERDEPVIAFAAYLRDIDEAGFDPEAPAATAEQRAAHLAAREAAEKAEHWLARTGDENRAREIHTAIGEGRKALIRLDAMRRGRPVPLAALDEAALTGFVDAAAAPYTEDRFRWAGKGSAEIFLDRPAHGRPALAELRQTGGKGLVSVYQHEKTDRTVRRLSHDLLERPERPVLYLVLRPEATHLEFKGDAAWRATVVDPEGLPETAPVLSGRGPAAFRHRLGALTVTVQGTGDAKFSFYPDCTCDDVCDEEEHWRGRPFAWFDGAFRQDVELRPERGLLIVTTYAATLWSIEAAAGH